MNLEWSRDECVQWLAEDLPAFATFDHAVEGFDIDGALRPQSSYVVVASQGRRDMDALRFALATGADYIALVASRKKAAKLMQNLRADGAVDLSDAVRIFGYLFTGAPPPVLGTECVAAEGCPGVCLR